MTFAFEPMQHATEISNFVCAHMHANVIMHTWRHTCAWVILCYFQNFNITAVENKYIYIYIYSV